MKPVSILAMVGLLAASAFAQGESPPAAVARVEFEKLTVRHLFDVTYTTNRQKVQSAIVIAVNPKTEQEGVSIGDELMKINGKAIKGLLGQCRGLSFLGGLVLSRHLPGRCETLRS